MYYNNQIWHWGVKGMKWGVRRYQNANGSLTDAGKKRYDRDVTTNDKKKKIISCLRMLCKIRIAGFVKIVNGQNLSQMLAAKWQVT